MSSRQDDCTCLTPTQLAQMQARNEVVQSRLPCPVHGEPDLSGIRLLPRVEHDGPMDFQTFDYGEEMQAKACPQCGAIDCMEDTHDG